jgi:hypothetical protein
MYGSAASCLFLVVVNIPSQVSHTGHPFSLGRRGAVKKISARLLFIVKVFLLGGETMRRLELEEQDVDIINQADKIMHKGTLISCLIDGDCETLALLAICSAYMDSALSLNFKKN